MKTETIVCDHCKSNLITNTSYPAKYTLSLSVVNTNRNTTGVEYAVCIKPPFEQTKHFCNVSCLGLWIKKGNYE